MINAETQLLYSSDYPHWDFDLPATISDLPFLSEKAKHNILGGTAARLFKLPPRNEKQKENLEEVRQSRGRRLAHSGTRQSIGRLPESSGRRFVFCRLSSADWNFLHAEHISSPNFDKATPLPDDAFRPAAVGDALVNTATASPTEAAPARTPAPEGLIDVRLTAIRYAARDTNLYELVRPDGKPLPAYEPGAHIDVHLPNGIVRQYSLINPEQPRAIRSASSAIRRAGAARATSTTSCASAGRSRSARRATISR